MSKKIIITIISFMLVFAIFASKQDFEARQFRVNKSGLSTERRDQTIVYEEQFNPDTEWETVDGTLPESWNEAWHLSTVGAFEGNSWWMGDEELGGYTSHRYIVMDTPSITLPANAELTFKLNYNVEGIGGTGGYDGWDGCNVRISTDDGATWTVITPVAPAYNSNSMYSFGSEFYEGEGIPGWGGSSNGWVDASFDLSSYSGDVKIRFAFASDPAYDTSDDESLFGMKVDNIVLGDFSSNGDGAAGDDQMVLGYGGIIGGDLWHIAEDATAPSPATVAACQNENGGYDPYLQNYIVSPAIDIPQGTGITVDFQVAGSINDPDEFPDVDFWSFEKSTDDGLTWSAVITNAQGQNIVFSDLPETYMSFAEAYQQGVAVDITEHANSTLRFRFGFMSDGDTPEGVGLKIDNFVISSSAFTPAPMNLEAQVDGSNVNLSWDNPFNAGGEEGWKTWAGNASDQVISYNNATEPILTNAAHKFDQNDLLGYNGYSVDKIRFMGGDPSLSYTVKIWTGETGQTEVASQAFTGTITPGEYSEVELDTPHIIDASSPLWIGFQVSFIQSGFYLDEGPAVVGKGIMVAQDDGPFSDVSQYVDANIMVGGYVTDSRGYPAAMLQSSNNKKVRDITGYKVYRSTESGQYDMNAPIAVIEGADNTSYTDETATSSIENFYVVVATYPEGESAPSNEVSAIPVSASQYVYSHDDGEMDIENDAQDVQDLYVKFTPVTHENYDYVKVYGMKVYLGSIGTINIAAKIYKADENGNPEESAALQGVLNDENLVEGWNTVTFNNWDNVEFEEGTDFFCSVKAIPGPVAFKVGVDTDNSGNSYIKHQGQEFEPYNEGNFMIRAIVDQIEAGNEGDDIVSIDDLGLSNFPNPFNPVTEIHYNIPAAGKVNIKIYNTKGQLVNTLVDQVEEAGPKKVTWTGKDSQGNDVSSGVYFYKVTVKNASSTKKMLLMK
ncbi:MAG: hypothetical protein CSB55_09065 [Candidatus Cloacimonadota bacterium]|nr:MAG: hypothetical protein CSB55_09065 [Candidatus Cloacimonadota bacterium]